MTAQLLAKQGHDIVLHARNASRASDAHAALPAATVIEGDVSLLRVCAGAPGDLDRSHRTRAWLAVSGDAAASATGR